MKDCCITSKYIVIDEKETEERIESFIKTVKLGIASLERNKYSVDTFADIIGVACSQVSDIFEVDTIDESIVVTSSSIPLDFEVGKDSDTAYNDFEEKVKAIVQKYDDKLIGIISMYNQLNGAYKELIGSVELEGNKKAKI